VARIDLGGIRKRAAKLGVELPPELETLAEAIRTSGPRHLRVASADPTKLGAPRDTFVPFLVFGDGGLLALWQGAIVHLGSEGERRVVAASMRDLCARIAKCATGVPELDEAEPPIVITIRGKPAALARAQEALDALFAHNDPKPVTDREELRAAVHRIAKKLIAGGISRTYRPKDSWLLKFRLTRAPLAIEVLDFGAYKPVPAESGLAPLAEALIAACKDPRRAQYELTVTWTGIVSIDRDRQLVLLPP
jgi:hypothetical protein